jgi:hypothetical protein
VGEDVSRELTGSGLGDEVVRLKERSMYYTCLGYQYLYISVDFQIPWEAVNVRIL